MTQHSYRGRNDFMNKIYAKIKTQGAGIKYRVFLESKHKIYKSKESLTKAYKKLFNKTIIPQINTGLSATVYTQVTDVEDELNGLMTYDRKVLKIDKEVLRDINSKMHLYLTNLIKIFI